jgi:sirohydrochlorin cobaltochelatase
MSVGLILAAHGSHISPNTAGIVWHYVDVLRQRGIADEVTACFWKEQPHLSHVLKTMASNIIVIVPIFTATGYFSQRIIPTEMELSGITTRRDGRIIHYTRTLGEHPSLKRIVQQRIEATLQADNLHPNDTAVVVIGHGTQRDTTTRYTTQSQVAYLQHIGIAAQVVDAYLDDTPNIPSIYQRTTAKNIVALPFFLAEGSHTTHDVPNALGVRLEDYPSQVNNRQVYYTAPIGTEDAICDLVVQLARETGHIFAEHQQDSAWGGFPKVGTTDLQNAIQAKGAVTFGDLILTEKSIAPKDSTCETVLTTPAALRHHIRENPFRSLATSDDLPRDWVIHVESVQYVPAVVETIYPGVLANWSAHQRGRLCIESFDHIIKRQVGMFRSLTNEHLDQHITDFCGTCTLHPTWHTYTLPPNGLPCASPCNHVLSHIKENSS